ncbi:MAG: tetratricopeptide repeat protein [Spirochaetales bacterium]|nr:tetratricopeptide repeat protein [Spirochaetales bacterium]
MKKHIPLALLSLLFVLFLWSCATGPKVISTDLSPSEYFQKAQEAVTKRGDYKTALRYYETFIERYPENLPKIVEAEYEIAFIYYSRKDFTTAEPLFQKILRRYEGENAELLPGWPRILSDRLLKEMKKSAIEEEEATGAE